MRRKPMVWTVHNKEAHNQIIGKKYSKILMCLLLRWSSRIHVLCNATLDEVPELQIWKKKVVMIPHGDYIGNFGEGNVNIREKYGIPADKKIILFTGKIGPYKNIELLVNAFVKSQLAKMNFALLLCGSCSNETYRKKLVLLADNSCPEIFYDFEYVPNELMGDYLNQSDILAAPYSKESILNSGTLWMAFSYKKSMICPLLACMKDVNGIDKITYTYDYENSGEHLTRLVQTLNIMGDDVHQNASILREKGYAAFLLMTKQTWASSKQNWLNLYNF